MGTLYVGKSIKDKAPKPNPSSQPNSKNIIRIPRPLGTTYLSQQYQLSNDERYKKQLIKRTVENFIANAMVINNRTIPLDQFAHYLNIPTTELITVINQEMEKVGKMFEGEDGKQFARATLFFALKKSLEIQSRSQSQSMRLLALQGDAYVPFLTSEVNKALQLEVNAIKPLTDILKLLQDKSTESPFLPQQQTNNQNNIYLTSDLALKMIEQQGTKSALNDPILLSQMGQLIEDGTPNVNAKSQDLTGIGIRYKGTQDTTLIPSNPLP